MDTGNPICNLCALQETKKLFSAGEAQLYKCQKCKLIFNWPLPKDTILHNKVEKHYSEIDPHQSVALSKNKLFNKLLDYFEMEYKTKGSLLDVGCGYGYFMQLAAKRGWNSSGVEIMEDGCDYIARALNLPVFKGELIKANYPSESFDVVTLIDVLPICPDPFGTLQYVQNILKTKGLAAIRLRNYYFQNILNLVYQWGNKAFTKLNIPNPSVFHLYSFTPTTIKMMLQKAGFKNIKVKNSLLTAGDPYCVIKRASLSKIIKELTYLLAQIIYYISLGKLVVGPSILAVAYK